MPSPARWCGVPVVLHESNAIPGRVTRLLGRLCTRVAVGLPEAAAGRPGRNGDRAAARAR